MNVTTHSGRYFYMPIVCCILYTLYISIFFILHAYFITYAFRVCYYSGEYGLASVFTNICQQKS